MWRLRTLCMEIRNLECGGNERRRIPLAHLVASILALIGLEILMVLWLYELPAHPTAFGRTSGLLAPSILLTHPKGPLCLLLILVGVAIATVCRDVAELMGKRAESAEQKAFELRRSLSGAYVLAGFTVAMTLFLHWGG